MKKESYAAGATCVAHFLDEAILFSRQLRCDMPEGSRSCGRMCSGRWRARAVRPGSSRLKLTKRKAPLHQLISVSSMRITFSSNRRKASRESAMYNNTCGKLMISVFTTATASRCHRLSRTAKASISPTRYSRANPLAAVMTAMAVPHFLHSAEMAGFPSGRNNRIADGSRIHARHACVTRATTKIDTLDNTNS